MSNSNAWLPLFPLNSVLFPGGVLPLKVFEARYIDMLEECITRHEPFGIVRARLEPEAGHVTEPGEIGCIAHIGSWDKQSPGLVVLQARGGERFRIQESRKLPDGRIEARVDMLAADSTAGITAIHLNCAKALKAVIDNINAKGRGEQGDRFVSPFILPLRLDEAGWVANRWCEILPIPLKARQKLLELDDAQSRLAIVHQYLQQHKIL
jgi:Lon protease-like protein